MKSLIVILFLLVLTACASVPQGPPFYPQIGMTEEEVVRHWGTGGSSYLETKYSDYKTTWYTRAAFGAVFPGCKREVARGNPFYFDCTAVHYKDGVVFAISSR